MRQNVFNFVSVVGFEKDIDTMLDEIDIEASTHQLPEYMKEEILFLNAD